MIVGVTGSRFGAQGQQVQTLAYTESDVILPEKPYLVRNQNIVDAVDVLIVVPAGPEADRSGTWATFRMAMRRGISIHLLMPEALS